MLKASRLVCGALSTAVESAASGVTFGSRQRQSAFALAVASGLSGLLLFTSRGIAQQVAGDPTVLQTASDGSTATTDDFSSGGTWGASSNYTAGPPVVGVPAATAPTAGYNYVDEGYRIRDLAASGVFTGTFGGDSLSLISTSPAAGLDSATSAGVGSANLGGSPYAYFTTKGNAGSVTTVNDLVLANAGVFFAYNNNAQTLSGNIYLVPTSAGTLSGVTLTASGGILDTHNSTTFTVTSNISGGGLLRVENSGGSSGGNLNLVVLSGSNTNSGGVVLDGTSTSAQFGAGPDLQLNSTTALGTGTFTVLPYAGTYSAGLTGLIIDNATGSSETLSTANPQVWNGNFSFGGTNPLEMGGNAGITMNQPVALTVSGSVLTEDSTIASPSNFGFTKLGVGTLALNGSISSTGFTNVSAGLMVCNGVIAGPVNLTGGFLEAGSVLLPGTLRLSNSLTLISGSALDLRISSTGSDEFFVGGQVTLGGALDILAINDFTPVLGTTYTIISDSAAPTIGTFSNDNGSGFITDNYGDTYRVNYAANASGDDVTLTYVAAVPEPASMALLAVPMFALMGRHRRRNI